MPACAGGAGCRRRKKDEGRNEVQRTDISADAAVLLLLLLEAYRNMIRPNPPSPHTALYSTTWTNTFV